MIDFRYPVSTSIMSLLGYKLETPNYKFFKNAIPTIERLEDEGMKIDEDTLSILRDSKCFERDD